MDRAPAAAGGCSRPRSNLSAPTWVDDPDFDIDHHVRRIALPKPGTLRQLLDLATLLVLDPFDRTRPLWQFIVVEGLRGGKAALVQKMHHTITDGEGGVQMSLQYLDFERDAAGPAAVDRRATTARRRRRRRHRPPRRVRDLVAGGLPAADRRRPPGARAARRPGADPGRRARPRSRPSAASSRSSPTSSRRTRRCGPSVAASATSRSCAAPFRETKDAAKRLGGTLNTAFLTAAAEAAGALPPRARRAGRAAARVDGGQHADRGVRRQRLLARPHDGADRRDADRRAVPAIQAARRRGPRQAAAAASLETLAAVAAALPTSLVTRLARQQAQTVDFATSNVRGSPVPVYIAGAQLLENYPIGPAGRRGVQPDAAVVPRQPGHGHQHRRGRGRPSRTPRQAPRRGVQATSREP